MAINLKDYDPALMQGANIGVSVDLTDLVDANGNEVIELDGVASAVNYVAIENAATGNGPDIEARGDDTNIDLNLVAKGTGKLAVTAGSSGVILTTASANGLAVGANGSTNPVLKVNASTASVATGLSITGAAAAGGAAVAVISSGTNENLTVDAKGSGTITLAGTSTGNVVVPRAFVQGTDATDRVTIKGIYMSPANVSVTVPSITAPGDASVSVDVSAAFSMAPALGDAVIAMPQEALPTNCLLTGAYVTGTDTILVTFASEGGNVTGAAKNFKFLVVDVT